MGDDFVSSIYANTGSYNVNIIVMRVYYYHTMIEPDFTMFSGGIYPNTIFDETSYSVHQINSTSSCITFASKVYNGSIPASGRMFLAGIYWHIVDEGHGMVFPYVFGIYNADPPWGQITDDYLFIANEFTIE